jgi:hypothetical protein
MKAIYRILRMSAIGVLVFLTFAANSSAQDPADKLFVVTHVDFTPNYTADGTKLLQQFATDTRHDPGAVRFELLQDNGRDTRSRRAYQEFPREVAADAGKPVR